MTTQPTRSPLAALVWGVAVPVLLWAIFCIGVLFVVPGYKKTVANLGIRLPEGAMLAIDVADWIATYWYVLPLSLPFLVPPDVLIILGLWRSGHRGLARLWCALMVALPIIAAVLVAVAINLPLPR